MAAFASKSIAILGAGITGLTAAYRLAQRGHRVRVFESSDRVGGAIRTELVDGWLIEAGPNSMLGGDPSLTALIDELGLSPVRLEARPEARNRFIVRGGRLVAAPLSPPALLISPLISGRAKFGLLTELFRRPRPRAHDISLQEFIRGHFGQELVDYGLNPFVSGVYAGNPRKLSARHAFPRLWEAEQNHGSILRGQIAASKARRRRSESPPGIISFQSGLQVLPDALAARLPAGAISRRAQVESLVPGSGWIVVWNDGRGPQSEKFDAVVAALPAPALARLRVGPSNEQLLAPLAAIEHPPVSSLFLGYPRSRVAHPLDGFGVLVPEIENRSVLGILFSSSTFSGRAPDGHVALTVMIGGTRQPALARLTPEKLLALIAPDLQQLLGVTGAPVFQRHTFWPRAIPQYNLGYEAHLETMAAVERAHHGLFIGGQARDGIGLPACVAAGEKLAVRAGA